MLKHKSNDNVPKLRGMLDLYYIIYYYASNFIPYFICFDEEILAKKNSASRGKQLLSFLQTIKFPVNCALLGTVELLETVNFLGTVKFLQTVKFLGTVGFLQKVKFSASSKKF